MADCGLKDSYDQRIGDLCRHKKLMEINLSGNEIEEMTCVYIGNTLSIKIIVDIKKDLFFVILAENTSLVYFNISWNLIRSFSSIAIFRAFEVII